MSKNKILKPAMFSLVIGMISALSMLGCAPVKTIELDMSFMKYMTVKNKNATRYGISDLKPNEEEQNGPYKQARSSENLDTFYLVEDEISNSTEDEMVFSNEGLNKVEFIKNLKISEPVFDDNGNIVDDNFVLNQDESNAKINDLYVDGNLVFMSFISKNVTEGFRYEVECYDGMHEAFLRVRKFAYEEDNFHRYRFLNSKYERSFVLDTNTGYIYNLPQIFNFLGHGICVAFSDWLGNPHCRYYISNNNFVVEKLTSNGNISTRFAATDKDGYTYILTSIDKKIEDKKLCYIRTTEDKPKCMYYGSDGYVYILDYDYGFIKYVNGERQDLTDDFVRLEYIGSFARGYEGDRVLYKKHEITSKGMGGVFNLRNDCTIVGDNYSFFIDSSDGIKYKYIDYDYYIDLSQKLGHEVQISSDEFKTLSSNARLTFAFENLPFYTNINNLIAVEDDLESRNYYKIVQVGKELKLVKTEHKEFTSTPTVMSPINKY